MKIEGIATGLLVLVLTIAVAERDKVERVLAVEESNATASAAVGSAYYALDKPCTPPTAVHETSCATLVKETIATMKDEADEADLDIGERIEKVLATPGNNFATECCEAGTEYDRFLFSSAVQEIDLESFKGSLDKKTALLVIDMQQDFTTGSFGQTCWGSGGETFASLIGETIKLAKEKKFTVIASKDFHPSDHCSFASADACKNTKDYADEELSPGKRYVNEFPPHCTWTEQEGKTVPQTAPESPFCKMFGDPTNKEEYKGPTWCTETSFVGASFHRTIADALATLPEDQVEVVFKGFDKDYDSFSAIPHMASSGKAKLLDAEKKSTGGYALPPARAKACHGQWDTAACYPTMEELANRGSDAGMVAIEKILNDRGIEKLIVVGLVYDFCVKETSIFAKELTNARSVQLLADLSRPSFDGKPGSPFTYEVCPGGEVDENENDFCSEGAGTIPLFQQVQTALQAADVSVGRLVSRGLLKQCLQ